MGKWSYFAAGMGIGMAVMYFYAPTMKKAS